MGVQGLAAGSNVNRDRVVPPGSNEPDGTTLFTYKKVRTAPAGCAWFAFWFAFVIYPEFRKPMITGHCC